MENYPPPSHSQSTDETHTAASVHFYVLADNDLTNRLQFVFRLVEKAYDQGLLILVIAADAEQLTAIDRLLWTAKPERFIAHEVIRPTTKSPLPNVLLTDHVSEISTVTFLPQVVVDLSYDSSPLNFPKIMLVANQNPEVLPNARMKYQAYVNHGIKPTVHKIEQAETQESSSV